MKITLWSRTLLEKLIVAELLKNIPHFLWNKNVSYCFHNSPPLVPVLSHMIPIHTPKPSFPKSILILSSRAWLYLNNFLWRVQIMKLCFMLSPNVLLNTLFWNILNLCPSLNAETKFYTHTKQQVHLYFCIF